MMKIKIQKNVPIPERRATNSKYRFAEMETGDSIFFPKNEANTSQLRQAASQYKRRNKGFNYMTRTTDKEIRLWRIK